MGLIVEYANDIVQLCEVFERAAQAGADEIKGELVDGVYRIEYGAGLGEEPAKPVRVQNGKQNADGSLEVWGEYYCPRCKKMIARGYSQRFPRCMWCGKAVEWDG